MPTAAKLVSAVLFAALGFWLGWMATGALSDQSRLGFLAPMGAGIGAMIGWLSLGGTFARSRGAGALGTGLKGAVFWAVWFLLGLGGVLAYRHTLRGRYDSPMEALTGAVQLGLEFGARLATAQILAALLLGGLAVGAAGGYAARRWR